MKFQFSEKKVRLPENVHAYAEKKVTKLDRYFNGDAEALVAFSVMKNRNQVELTVHAANTWFRARESTSDMFASIDAAVATIEGQIRKNKTRWPAACGRMPLFAPPAQKRFPLRQRHRKRSLKLSGGRSSP